MSKSGIVNGRMVITEEKILSNIDKVQKLINPNSKKKIIQLEEDAYFKDLVESIKSYLAEYPKKKNFPIGVYKATYGLVEFATTQFENNTKKIENLIKQRESNIALSGVLRDVFKAVESKEEKWEDRVSDVSSKFDEDIINALNTIGKAKSKKSQEYISASKLIKVAINNLEINLHIEIDMDRLEDSSKALSYIGIEIADALKLIPVPEEQLEAVAEQNLIDEKAALATAQEKVIIQEAEEKKDASLEELIAEQEQYIQETTFEAKPSLWQRIKNSKIARAATYLFRIKIRIELPSNALPEGRGENV